MRVMHKPDGGWLESSKERKPGKWVNQWWPTTITVVGSCCLYSGKDSSKRIEMVWTHNCVERLHSRWKSRKEAPSPCWNRIHSTIPPLSSLLYFHCLTIHLSDISSHPIPSLFPKQAAFVIGPQIIMSQFCEKTVFPAIKLTAILDNERCSCEY